VSAQLPLNNEQESSVKRGREEDRIGYQQIGIKQNAAKKKKTWPVT
jgi:hypothetical protein